MDTQDFALRTTGRGPTVLWLHGYTMDSSVWSELWTLMPGWRHVGLDLPGHGRSAPLRAGTHLPDLAADIAEVCRVEGAQRVVALSFGSMVALQLAIDHPGLLSHLVLGAPTIAGRPSEPGTGDRYRELIRAYCLFGPGEHLTDVWMKSPPDIFRGTETLPRLRERLRETINHHRWEELRSTSMHALTNHVHDEDALASIDARTLVFSGTRDMPGYRQNAQVLRHVVPNCELQEVERAGHLCLLEAAEDVAPDIDARLPE